MLPGRTGTMIGLVRLALRCRARGLRGPDPAVRRPLRTVRAATSLDEVPRWRLGPDFGGELETTPPGRGVPGGRPAEAPGQGWTAPEKGLPPAGARPICAACRQCAS